MSDPETESEKSSSEEEMEEFGSDAKMQEKIPEYEKQRLLRIAENKARMEALGLTKIASSLMGSSRNQKSSSKRKGKRKIDEDDDEDFKPNDDDDNECSDDSDEDFEAKLSPSSRKRNAKVSILFMAFQF